MFTGIVEALGEITAVESTGTNRSFWISSVLWPELKIDQSLSHEGVCLTVDALENGRHRVTAIAETLRKTTLGQWRTGQIINLERCMQLNGRLDGHIVQGHVDTTAICTNRVDENGSWQFDFSFDSAFARLVIEKGSICLNGTSLTVFNVTDHSFSVAIIPYTFEHTSIHQLQVGEAVNIEFDIIGKYIARFNELKQS